MDDLRFDRLTRLFAVPTPRRRLLAGLLAGATGLLGSTGVTAAGCRAPGRTCSKDAHCCSGLCGTKDATGRRRCQCQSAADCPAPPACHTAVCAEGVCGTTANTAGAACNRAAPDCCAGLVCACDPADDNCSDAPWLDRAAAAAVCRTNQAPWAPDLNLRFPWKSSCHPISFDTGDADGDAVGIRIETFPENGFLTGYLASTGFGQFAAAGLPAASGAARVGRLPATGLAAPSGAAAGASGSAVVGAMQDEGCTIYRGYVGGSTFPEASCNGCPDIGSRCKWIVCYVTYSDVFTGFDSFTYVAIDMYGGVSEPASVSIEVFEI